MRRIVFTAALMAAGLAATGVAPALAVPPPVARSAPTTQPEKTALDIARETGKPVAVPEATTETREVLANPDGTFTLRSYASPQRVKRDGRWVPIDTTLRANADGSVSTVATIEGLKFSGGGTGPAITLAGSRGKIAWSWPAELPKPSLKENTATYKDVYPGVDLVVSAGAVGYTHVLVVHDKKAAENQALREIKLTATTEGLALAAKDGVLSARDAKGDVVFSGSTPVMWDSDHREQSGPAPTVIDPGGAKLTKLDVTTSQVADRKTDLSIRPNLEALAGKDVKYPVYIDPGMNGGQQAWGEVTQNGYFYFNANMNAQVGRCWNGEGECGDLTVARSYFRIDTSPLQKRNGYTAVVWSAEMWFTQVWGATRCTAQPVTLTKAGYFDAGLRWNNQPLGADLDSRSSGAGVQCNGAAGVKFDNQAVKDYAQESANNSWSNVHMALKAPNEGNDVQWKKFGTSGGTAPHFDISYSFPPGPAAVQGVSNGVTCTGVAITPDARPRLYGTATDNNNPPLRVGLHYEVWNSVGSELKASGSEVVASGTQAGWQIPTALGDGDYAYRIAVYNEYPGDAGRNLWNGTWSPWYWFRIQSAPITAAPAIVSSVDYPDGYWGAPQGAAGAIAVNANGAANISGYAYSFVGSGTAPVPNTQSCDYTPTSSNTGTWAPASAVGPTWLPIPAGLTAGFHTLHVRSFDDAHNASPETSQVVYVAPNTGQSVTRFEAETVSATQPPGQSRSLSSQSNCCNASWSGGQQLLFQGSAVGQSFSLYFTVAGEADYQLAVGLTKATDYAQVAFTLDGQAIGQPDVDKPVGSFDAYNPKVINALTQLGIRRLTTGSHTLTATITGTNPNSAGDRYRVGLDHITLTKTTRYEAELPAQVTTSQPTGQNVPLSVEQQTATNGGPWSQGAQLLFAAPDKNKSFDLTFSVPAEADYALSVAMSKKENRGKVRIAVDGIALMRTDSEPWDGYQASGGRTTPLMLGGAHLKAGQHKLTITVVGKNDASSGHTAGVDYLTAVAINNLTAASFTDAMNNKGIGSETTPANLDHNGFSISTATLAAAGLAPGSKVAVNRATFSIPTANPATGNDNVVAMGQTIPLPAGQQVKASSVGMLVASTCGETKPSTMTITYTDGTTSNPAVPGSPNWTDDDFFDDNAVVTLPHRLQGTEQESDKPNLYAVFAPADPRKTIASVTLPSTGANVLPNACGQSSLHVFSIAPAPVATGWLGAFSTAMWGTEDRSYPGGSTYRMIVHPSETSQTMRVKLSNATANVPNTILRTSLAAQSGTGAGTTGTPVLLTFGGNQSITLPAGGEVYSDPVPFPNMTGSSGNLVVSVALPASAPEVPQNTAHNTATFRAPGDAVTSGADVYSGPDGTWYYAHTLYLAGIEISTNDPSEGTVAVLSNTWYSDAYAADEVTWWPTWTDFLAEALGPKLKGSIANTGYYSDVQDALDHREQYMLGQPNLRTLILDTNSPDEGETLESYRADLVKLLSPTSTRGVKKYLRPDGTPISVVLCTISPRGLDADDPRELLRKQLNNEIRTNYANLGADNFIDFDAAVRDPAAPNKVQASLWDAERGTQNTEFERRLAQTVSDAVDGFPPLTL
ncbi:SGNH hydrolase [Lentzea sp.]|uniref:SGNH hydrolase n=1 Tax=Lentzea sp. TaxID=56099 RepID=UPI002ED3FFFA